MENVHWVLVVGVIIIFGSLGGTVNYFFTYTPSNDSKSKWDQFEFTKSLVVGITAAFLMPLFLNMISSDLIRESRTDIYKLFVFAGFCLVAAISSKAFIQSISQRVFRELNDLKEKVDNVEKDIKPIIEKETEDYLEAILEQLGKEEKGMDDTDTNRVKVLKALCIGKCVFRSLDGICNEVRLDLNEVNQVLSDLIAENLVGLSIREGETYFFITQKGKEYLNWYINTKNTSLLEKYREKEDR